VYYCTNFTLIKETDKLWTSDANVYKNDNQVLALLWPLMLYIRNRDCMCSTLKWDNWDVPPIWFKWVSATTGRVIASMSLIIRWETQSLELNRISYCMWHTTHKAFTEIELICNTSMNIKNCHRNDYIGTLKRRTKNKKNTVSSLHVNAKLVKSLHSILT